MIGIGEISSILNHVRNLALVGACSILGPPSIAHAGTMATTPEMRQAAISSCTGDVIRLCPSAVFDEEKVFACMKINRAQLTPGCRSVFDQGAKTVR